MAQGFGIREGLMLRNALLDMKDRQKADTFEKEYKTHLGGLQSDPENYKPDAGYDPKAFNQARLQQGAAALQDQQIQKGVFEHQRAAIDAQYDKTLSYIKQAQAAHVAQDVDSEFKAYELAYESTFDGNDMVIGENRTSYTLTNKLTGETTTKTFKDTNTMRMAMKQMSDVMGQSETYAQQALGARMENAKLNANQDWTPLKNDKGALAWTTKQFNNDNGEVERVYEIQGDRVSAEQARKMGFMTGKQRKTFAEATEKERVPKGITPKERVKGTMEKDAELYMRAYKGLSIEEATDMVRQDKANKYITEALNAFKKEEMLELSDPEDLEKWKQERERLTAGFQPTQPRGRGLPTDEAEDTTDISQIPKAGKDTTLTKKLVKQFIQAAKGDLKKAREFAKEKGYSF